MFLLRDDDANRVCPSNVPFDIRPPSVLDEFIASYFFNYCLYESEGSRLNVTGKSLNGAGGDHVMHAKLLSKCLEDYARKRE